MRLIDRYFYHPYWWQKVIVFALLPLSFFYCIIAYIRRKLSSEVDLHIPIVSVGNLVVGGSGKTPFIVEVAKAFPEFHVAVVSRGYKRKSKGLVVVSNYGEILCNQEEAGDEPYLIAKSVKNTSVIVCKKRKDAINKAKEMGCDVVLLDDGFRFNFKKLNIILQPKLKPYYSFCLPSGMYREWSKSSTEADLLLQEGEDYKREVEVLNPTSKMLLLTGIANPQRLNEFLSCYANQIVGREYYPDHARFEYDEIRTKMQKYQATSLLITSKDCVKLEDMGFELSLIALKLKIKTEVMQKIKDYIQGGLDEIASRR